MKTSTLTVAATALIASSTFAQINTVSLPSGARSVRVVGDGLVVASTFVDGVQYAIDAQVPTSASISSSTNPQGSDQWFEAEYTDAYGGRMAAAYRSGGLSLFKANDILNDGVDEVDHVGTKYHFRGMRFYEDPNTGDIYLYYAEHNVSNTGGGLRIFQLTDDSEPGDTLTEHPNTGLLVGEDCNGLAITNGHLFANFRTGNNAARELRVYSLAIPDAPAQVHAEPLPWVNGGSAAKLTAHPTQPCLYGALQGDGLVHIDVSTPTAPIVTTIVPPSTLFGVRGVEPLNSFVTMAWGAASGIEFQLLMVTFPGCLPFSVDVLLPTGGFRTRDVDVDISGRVYIAGDDTNDNGYLQIW